MKTLDAEERRHALDAVQTLFMLELIDIVVYLYIKDKIEENTGV